MRTSVIKVEVSELVIQLSIRAVARVKLVERKTLVSLDEFLMVFHRIDWLS